MAKQLNTNNKRKKKNIMKTQFEDYILEEAEEILQNDDNLSCLDMYERMEELMLDNGYDLDNIEDLLYDLM